MDELFLIELELPLPHDPLHPSRFYSYGSSKEENLQNYVVAVALEKPTNDLLTQSELQRDIDGTVYGINCDDPVYCVGF